MAAHAKYQPAPQRDSLDAQNYTQPPPSYQAAGPSDGLLGASRDEDDNVPDDFKVFFTCLVLVETHQQTDRVNGNSSAARSQKPRSTSGCTSSAKSTRS